MFMISALFEINYYKVIKLDNLVSTYGSNIIDIS